MNKVIRTLISKLIDLSPFAPEIIFRASPVPCFGNLYTAQIATLGLNPSNKEFVDEKGKDLTDNDRRLPSLTSLCIENWGEALANEEQINLIRQSCEQYFHGKNSYDVWFRQLNSLISGTRKSYYPPSEGACHLDLIPYATFCKWAKLTRRKKNFLLSETRDLLSFLLKESKVKALILNGTSVVRTLEGLSNEEFNEALKPEWELPRANGRRLRWRSYEGTVSKLGGIDLGREIKVLGFNHNIQSSRGITNEVRHMIRNWITDSLGDIFPGEQEN